MPLRQAARAALLLALLLPVLLPGCSGLALPQETMPAAAAAAGADPSYHTLVANQIKSLFKDRASYQAFEISGFRWLHAVKGWSWLTCVRFQDHGHRRTYALFIKDGAVIDSRYAVETDTCDGESYLPFDPAMGTTNPADFSIRQPIY